jgi:hypothetical protein
MMDTKSKMRVCLGIVCLALLIVPAIEASSQELERVDRYVLIVANNSGDEQLEPLRYADDDGVLYYRQFLPYAKQIKLLTMLDDDSQRRFPDMAGTARLPTQENFRRALSAMYAAMQADGRKVRKEFVLVYVGHGGMDDQGRGYLYLQDGKFTRSDLFNEVVAASPADFTHLILDACNSFSMVAGRGEDDFTDHEAQARFENFLAGHDLEDYPSVGVLVATSENREVHEWSHIKAGIFSHQVRSALSGAADVNGDLRIEYSEVAAFVDAASVDLVKVGKKLSVFAWPPKQNRKVALLDVSRAQSVRKLQLGNLVAGRYYLEDEKGRRVIEFHKAAGNKLAMVIPTEHSYYLRSQNGETEIPKGKEPVILEEISSSPNQVAHRGAVDKAFEQGLFAMPYSKAYYLGYMSGRPQMLSVSFETAELEDRDEESTLASEIGWEASYTIHPALLLFEGIEHGGAIRMGLKWSRLIETSLGLEVGFADGYPGTGLGVLRIALMPGLILHWAPNHVLDLFAATELGYAVVDVMGSKGSTDYFVPVGRLRFGVKGKLTKGLWLGISGGIAAHLITQDGSENIKTRPEFLVSFSW